MSLAAAADTGLRLGLLLTAFGFGLRHGIDWDHIAAITDITGSTEKARRSMVLAALYALGHGLVVFGLGVLAIAAGGLVPVGIDSLMERVVGLTLLLLGAYVFYSLIRHGRDFRMRSRWMLVFAAAHRMVAWFRARRGPRHREVLEIVHDHEHGASHGHSHEPEEMPPASGGTAVAVRHRHKHRHVARMPDDPFMHYGAATSFGVGMIHGVGAETPTQVVLFVTAAGVSGAAGGILLLVAFLGGLFVSNTLVALASTFGFLRAGRSFPVYASVAVVTGIFSLMLGGLLLFGEGGALPAILAG